MLFIQKKEGARKEGIDTGTAMHLSVDAIACGMLKRSSNGAGGRTDIFGIWLPALIQGFLRLRVSG